MRLAITLVAMAAAVIAGCGPAARLPQPGAASAPLVLATVVVENQREGGESAKVIDYVAPEAGSSRSAPGPTPTAAPPAISRTNGGPREVLDQFMSARIHRQDGIVQGLLTEGLREALAAGKAAAIRSDLLAASNPCWYRYAVQGFNQSTSTAATAQVRIYQHFWGGDMVGGPPRSWEQDVSLVKTPSGWRVDQVGEPRDNREELGEPHGLHASACNAEIAGPTPSAGTLGRPYVSQLRLASYVRMDDHADPRGGPPVYIVEREIEVRAKVSGVERLDVRLGLNARDTVARATAVPDANGDVAMRLQLPKVGMIYVMEGEAVLSDQSLGPSGGAVNERNESVLPAGGFRVVAERE